MAEKDINLKVDAKTKIFYNLKKELNKGKSKKRYCDVFRDALKGLSIRQVIGL